MSRGEQEDRDHDWEPVSPYMTSDRKFYKAQQCKLCGQTKLTEELPEKPTVYWTGLYLPWTGRDDCFAVIRHG